MDNTYDQLTQRQQLAVLRPFARAAMAQFAIQPALLRVVNHAFNTTYAVSDTAGQQYALRLNTQSLRDPDGVAAELQWIEALAATGLVNVPTPAKTVVGAFAAQIDCPPLQKTLLATLARWLPGRIVGARPTRQQLTQIGRVTALLHQQSKDWRASGGATFPHIDGIFMNSPDNLSHGDDARLSPVLYQLLSEAMVIIAPVYTQLAHRFAIQPIHADIHPYNLMWHVGQLSVFDFDDAGMGWPIQDLAVTCYYLRDIVGAEAQVLAGYTSVATMPAVSSAEFEALLMARGILLFNDLIVSQSHEEREFVPEYCRRMELRLRHFLDTGTFQLLQ
jgi:Ser/Thr protein kinase RdoA (MazF antagonist)